MYNFRDINDASDNAVMPSEALKLNGEYIEDLIPGYRTLYVKGREALSPDLDYFETGIRDGSTLKYKRYPARIIVVGYQLRAASNKAFRDAYNALGGILNVTDAEMIFRDEDDKYFTGTPSAIGEVPPGRNAVTGEIEFICTDPFKYSVDEYEVEASDEDGLCFLLDYNGTYKSFPTFEADFFSESETDGDTETALTGSGDCGFVAFFNEYEKIIQLGEPDEEDGEDLAKSQTLVNQSFKVAGTWGTAAQKLWPVNSGIVSDSSVISQVGTIGLKQPSPTMFPDERYLMPLTYGSGSKYHGPSITRTLPADASGEVGAANFTFSYRQKMSIGGKTADTKQCGAFQVLLTDANGKTVAGVNIYKSSTGKTAKLRFYVNGKVKETMDMDLSCYNKYIGNNKYKNGKLVSQTVKASTITKSGQTVTFNMGGIKRVYRDSDATDLAVTKITFTFTAYGSKTPLSYNGLYSAKFVKNNCDTWRDVPNKFSADDVAVADCKDGTVYLNDAERPDLGALGNDWEEMYLQPGLNQIGISYSDWVTSPPTFKMRYREVFL